MNKSYIADERFEKIDFTASRLPYTEYESCSFAHCNFAGADLSGFRLVECTFTDCDVSNIKLQKTTLNDVRFSGSKLLGLHFENCSDFLFTVSFENCTLDFSSFYRRQLKKTMFNKTSLQQVDFTEADLTGSVFDGCNLAKAVFDNTILERVDFRTALHYSIDPERNRIKKAKFDRLGLTGLLEKYGIDVY